MTYTEFREAILARAGQQYGWVMLTQEKYDMAMGRDAKLYTVEALVFGAGLQAMIEADKCDEAWIADTVDQMLQTLNMLSADSQRRRDNG
jgi:hypothetical protein